LEGFDGRVGLFHFGQFRDQGGGIDEAEFLGLGGDCSASQNQREYGYFEPLFHHVVFTLNNTILKKGFFPGKSTFFLKKAA
jgi:hypothetical protein